MKVGEVYVEKLRDEGRGAGMLMYCRCNKVELDPSATMYGIIGAQMDWEDLSVEWEREE